jgi:uncharacterized protein (DUF58 family)
MSDAPASGTSRSLRRSRTMRLTRRGAATVAFGGALVIAAYAVQRTEVLVIGIGALALVGFGLLWVWWRRPQLEVSRRFESQVAVAGRPQDVALGIRNLGASASPPLVWNDAIPWPEPDIPNELDGIPPRRPRGFETPAGYTIYPPRRGHYPIGPFVVEHGDPFGMASSVAALGTADRLVVVPAVAPLVLDGPVLDDGDGLVQLALHRATDNDDDLTTREYRPGDALRRVHWRVSARRGELMVRQEETRSNPDARVLVDTRADGYADLEPDRHETWTPPAHSEAFEWVVRMTAAVSTHLDDEGFRVTLDETAPAQLEGLGDRSEAAGRGEAFLESLAGAVLLDPASLGAAADLRRLSPAQGDGPVFAILGNPSTATLDWVQSRRDPQELAVAFLAGATEVVARRLSDAGWAVVRVDPHDDPAWAWAAAGAAVRQHTFEERRR